MKKNEDLVLEESTVANLFSNFFENAVNSLDIKKKEPCGKIYCLSDPAETVI